MDYAYGLVFGYREYYREMQEVEENGNLGEITEDKTESAIQSQAVAEEEQLVTLNPKSPLRLATKIEAILYLKGQSLSLGDLCEGTGGDRQQVEEALIELMSDYAHRDSALEVVETPNGYSLQLRSAFQNLIHDLVPAELGLGALRTLAAIALKTPILQTDLINLRGSTAYQQVQELVELGFVRKRRQANGRSYWLEVTDKFHHYFEIEQLSEAIKENLTP